MPLRMLARLLSNPQIIDQLANSAVMRRLAQITHAVFQDASQAGREMAGKVVRPEQTHKSSLQDPRVTRRLISFSRRFANILKHEMQKSNRMK